MSVDLKLSPVEEIIDQMKDKTAAEIAEVLEQKFGHPFTIMQVHGVKGNLVLKRKRLKIAV